jgi:sulfate permease, SulP family
MDRNPGISPRSRLAHWFPILDWLPRYQRTWLRGDFIAALTVVALLVPEGMAYAVLAGLPPETAFYVAPVALLVYAVLGTSRQQIVGVSSTVAVMSLATVSTVATPGSEEFIVLSAALALLVGVFSLLFGILKLGRVARFFSESVLTGFVTGLALIIAVRQMPKILGYDAEAEHFLARIVELAGSLPDVHTTTLIVGAGTLALMVFLERFYHRIPAALVALGVSIGISQFLGLESAGVEVVGDIPSGLAPPVLPAVSLTDLSLLAAGALGITLVVFAEALGPAGSFARRHGYRIDPDRELIGLGAANIGAGLFQGFSVGASLSRSAANDAAGARTQMSSVIAAVLVAVVALFFTPLFSALPEATLGVIVIVAISRMIKIRELQRLLAVRKADFLLAVFALGGLLLFDVLPGLLIAVVASFLVLIYRASEPRLSVLNVGNENSEETLVDRERVLESQPVPGVLIVRPDEGLYFANAGQIREQILLLSESEPDIAAVVIDLELSSELDVPAADSLAELYEALQSRGVRMVLARVHAEPRATLKQHGLLDELGETSVYRRTLHAAMDIAPSTVPSAHASSPE